jgi:hypothetical protein
MFIINGLGGIFFAQSRHRRPVAEVLASPMEPGLNHDVRAAAWRDGQ